MRKFAFGLVALGTLGTSTGCLLVESAAVTQAALSAITLWSTLQDFFGL